MTKSIGFRLALLLALSMPVFTQDRLARYPKIQAFEVRPGIILIPVRNSDNELCEIGIQRLHFSPDVIRVDATLSRTEVMEILDELVPVQERGAPSQPRLGGLVSINGPSTITTLDYDYVTFQIFGASSPTKRRNEISSHEVLATVKWKQRPCK